MINIKIKPKNNKVVSKALLIIKVIYLEYSFLFLCDNIISYLIYIKDVF